MSRPLLEALAQETGDVVEQVAQSRAFVVHGRAGLHALF
jgi:hypothetical protein